MNTSRAKPVLVETTVSGTEDRTTAIVAYLTLFGFIAAVVLHHSKKTPLGAFHLRQSLGLMLSLSAVLLAAPFLAHLPLIGWLLGLGLWCGVFVLWLRGLLSATKGEMRPVAVLGRYFQNWLGGVFE